MTVVSCLILIWSLALNSSYWQRCRKGEWRTTDHDALKSEMRDGEWCGGRGTNRKTSRLVHSSSVFTLPPDCDLICLEREIRKKQTFCPVSSHQPTIKKKDASVTCSPSHSPHSSLFQEIVFILFFFFATDRHSRRDLRLILDLYSKHGRSQFSLEQCWWWLLFLFLWLLLMLWGQSCRWLWFPLWCRTHSPLQILLQLRSN